MANKHRGYVEIELDKPRTLKFDLNALAEIEDKLGVSISELGKKDLTIKQMRSVLFAGLMHEDDELTEKHVGALVGMDNINYVTEKIGEAFANAGKN